MALTTDTSNIPSIPSAFRHRIKNPAPGVYRYKPQATTQLYMRLSIVSGIITALLSQAASHGIVPLSLLFILSALVTCVSIIMMFIMRSSEDTLIIDCNTATLCIGEKNQNRTSSWYALHDIGLGQDPSQQHSSVLDFVNSAGLGEIYRIRLTRREQSHYPELVQFFTVLLQTTAVCTTTANTSSRSSSIQLLISIVVTLGLFFSLIFISISVPVLGAYITNTGIFGAFAFLFLLIAILVGLNVIMGQQSRHWPSVTGEIVQKSIDQQPGSSSSSPSFSPSVQYRYRVGERTLLSRWISCHSEGTLSLEAAQRKAAQWEVGKAVPVYYDPRKPANSVLITGIDGSSIFLLILFSCTVAVLSFFALRDWEGLHTERYKVDWNNFVDDYFPVKVDFAEDFSNARTPLEQQLASRLQDLGDTLQNERDRMCTYYAIEPTECGSRFEIAFIIERTGTVCGSEISDTDSNADPVRAAIYQVLDRQNFVNIVPGRQIEVRCRYRFR